MVYGYYWSSTLSNNDYADYLGFSALRQGWDSYTRFNGLQVRPVWVNNGQDEDLEDNSSSRKVFDEVDEPPAFPGGRSKLSAWLGENISYPLEALLNDIQGRVIVSFIVEIDGSISDVHLVQSVDPLLDAEAVRVVRSMPRWIPGKNNGTLVPVKFNLPITFKP